MVRNQRGGRDYRGDPAQFSQEPLAPIREQLSIKNRGKISHDRDRAPEKRQDGSQSAHA